MNRLEIVEEILFCSSCELAANCNSPVPFYGPAPAEICVVGEAPGATEDAEGRPFVGRAGQLIRAALSDVGVDPDSVAWVNTVSCFPHGTPSLKHVDACHELKMLQLELVAPSWVLMLGKVSLQGFRYDLGISKAKGRPFLVPISRVTPGEVLQPATTAVGFATYHPAAGLRNRVMEQAMREDLAAWKKMVDGGSDQWWEHIPDTCAFCANLVESFDQYGIGACAGHRNHTGVSSESSWTSASKPSGPNIAKPAAKKPPQDSPSITPPSSNTSEAALQMDLNL